ncbi:MAG: hypothetical protein AUI50_05690 [Crenarchaeota archaeon 13_1_40CM_2_52_14]|nr:MAG: hypothetical protein AUI50_05690 [Crenarchaeota archaeon 13_1_40CM_2_52_14]
MKRSTLALLAVASGFYLLLLIIFRDLIPESVTPSLSLLALPLVLLAFILTLDLRRRSTSPIETRIREEPRTVRARDVKSLTRQVEVAGKASPAYFETILRNRLRDLLAEKVSLETGMEKDAVKKALADYQFGPRLLKDPRTYALLYYPPPRSPDSRLQMLREIIDRIEDWKA